MLKPVATPHADIYAEILAIRTETLPETIRAPEIVDLVLSYAFVPPEKDSHVRAYIHRITLNNLDPLGETLCSIKEIVLIAVRKFGSTLRFASVSLRNDREVVLGAIAQNSTAIQFASETLRNELSKN